MKPRHSSNTLLPSERKAQLNPAIPATYSEIAHAEKAAQGISADNSGMIGYWRLILRHKGTLIVAAVAGGVVGLLLTLPQVSIYQARTSLEIQGLNGDFLNMRAVDPTSNSSESTASEAYLQTQIKILQSDSLTDRVLSKMRLGGLLIAAPESSRLSGIKEMLGISESDVKDPAERAIRRVAKTLSVRSAGQTRIVEMRADSTSPKLAADFINTLASEYMTQNLEARYNSTQNTGVWLKRQMDEMRTNLEQSENRLQGYARTAGLLYTSEKDNVAESKLKQLQVDLTNVQSDRVAKQSRFELAARSPAESLPDVLGDLTMRDDLMKITELRRQHAELAAVFTAENPKMMRVQAQIASLESALQKQRTSIVTRIRNDFEEAQRKESLLASAYALQVALVTHDTEKGIQYNILKREVESNQQLYDSMLQKVKESGIASAMRASNIRVVDPAAIPPKPYRPSFPQNVSLGMLGGVLLGLGFVTTREQADRTFQEPGQIGELLGISELGVIPSAKVARLSRYFPKDNSPSSVSSNAVTDRIELSVGKEEISPLSEAFRYTLLSILYSLEFGKEQRVLVLTSSSSAEGKTTVASNLAIAIAQTSKSVLLIDGDMRKPRIHDVFGLSNQIGFSDLIQGDSSGPMLTGAIQPTSIKNLSVLTSGSHVANVTILLCSDRTKELLDELRAQYDMIIIDSPPMLQIPDARMLGRMADSVILVIRSGQTTRDAALATRERLEEDGTHVLGAILNNWNPRNSTNGYYGDYNGTYKRDMKYYSKA